MNREETLLELINRTHTQIFQNRHNWLSPLTSDDERKSFITRHCDWWNLQVVPAMDSIGAKWNAKKQRYEVRP